ncbi:MAG: polysaccharide deacetylase family protein [Spirochaetia bacterium]|nr:polysaccharide deacetylase family protein [Spirochaetia bacterium]
MSMFLSANAEVLRLAASNAVPSGSFDGSGNTFLEFGVKAPIGSSYTWELPEPFKPGWYKVIIKWNTPRTAFRQLAALSTGTPSNPKLDLYFQNPDNTGISRLRWYSAHPIKSFQITKTQNRDVPSRPIEWIDIEPADGEDAAASSFLDLTLQGDKLDLPGELKAGLYRIQTASGSPSMAELTGGGSIRIPTGGSSHFYASRNLSGLRVENPGSQKYFVLERVVTAGAPDFGGLEQGEVMAPFDATKNDEIMLEADAGAAVKLPIFPLGKTVAILTTWDDGPIQDRKLLGILKEAGFPGTFFLNHHSVMTNYISEIEAAGHEVASHSWSHPAYWLASPKRCRDESVSMRRFLENIVGHPVISFAYPFNVGTAWDEKGNYVERGVLEAGYLSARSTLVGAMSLSRYTNIASVPSDGHYRTGAEKFLAIYEEAKKREGGVFYFWGHAWELDTQNGWNQLDGILKALGGRSEAWYATQGQLFLWKNLREIIRIETDASNPGKFRLIRPWLHPFFKDIAFSLNVTGSKSVLWKGKSYEVKDGRVDLPW